jgi:hypothetical protein
MRQRAIPKQDMEIEAADHIRSGLAEHPALPLNKAAY